MEKSEAVAAARGAAKDDGASSKEHRKILLNIDAMVNLRSSGCRSITAGECAYTKVRAKMMFLLYFILRLHH